MGSLAPSQSSRLVSCFALTQSVSLDLVSSKLEKISVVSAPVFKTTGTASLTGVSRKSCTRFTFHLLPFSEPSLHMRSRSERSSVGCSGSEQDKAQNSAIKSIPGHRSASSSSYKRGSVSLLGGCSTPNTPIITAFSPPSCATDEVFLHVAARTLRSSSASHPGSRVSPARLAVNGPNFNCLWAWPSTTKEESGHLLSQSIPIGLISLASLRMNCSVGSPTLLPVPSSSSTKERILFPCLFSVKGDDSSAILPRVCFNLLTGLSLCVAVCTGSEGANEKTTSVLLVGESWFSTSQHKVTKSQLYDFVVHASSTHPSLGLNSLSSSDEDLSCLILIAVVAYVYFLRGCLIPSGYCSSSS